MTQEWNESEKVLRFRKPYKQPAFHDTPHEENADNTRYAIHHFAKPTVLRRYNNPVGYDEANGISDRGDHTEIQIWIEVQPISGEESQLLAEGERAESKYEFWYDPYHPKQMEINNTPVYLRQSDSRFVSGDGVNADIQGGHADIILWMGELYIIRKLENWSSSSYEEGNGQNTGYQWGVLKLWRDRHQLRRSTKETVAALYE